MARRKSGTAARGGSKRAKSGAATPKRAKKPASKVRAGAAGAPKARRASKPHAARSAKTRPTRARPATPAAAAPFTAPARAPFPAPTHASSPAPRPNDAVRTRAEAVESAAVAALWPAEPVRSTALALVTPAPTPATASGAGSAGVATRTVALATFPTSPASLSHATAPAPAPPARVLVTPTPVTPPPMTPRSFVPVTPLRANAGPGVGVPRTVPGVSRVVPGAPRLVSLRDEVERALNAPSVPRPAPFPTRVNGATPPVGPRVSLPSSWSRVEPRPPIIHVIAPPTVRQGMSRTWAHRAGTATRRAALKAERFVHVATDRLERWTPASWSRTRGRRIVSRAASLALLVALVVVIPLQFGPRGTSASQPGAGARGAYLGELIGVRHVIRVHASSQGPLYTVLDATTRRVLAEDLPADEVYRQFPDLNARTLRTGPDAEPRDPQSLLRPLMTAEPHRPELP